MHACAVQRDLYNDFDAEWIDWIYFPPSPETPESEARRKRARIYIDLTVSSPMRRFEELIDLTRSD